MKANTARLFPQLIRDPAVSPEQRLDVGAEKICSYIKKTFRDQAGQQQPELPEGSRSAAMEEPAGPPQLP